MSRPRFYTDEDVQRRVATELRSLGFDAVSVPEVGRRGYDDAEQLAWAVSEGRAVITFNIGHYVRLHSEYLTRGDHHAGIIVSPQRAIGRVIRRLVRLGQTIDADGLVDQLIWLNNWDPI
jgi:hypothetical protein